MRIVGKTVLPPGARVLLGYTARRVRVLLTVMMMAAATSCFQMDPIEVGVAAINVPPVVDLAKVEPASDSVIRIDGPEVVSFNVPVIFDANGMEEEDIYGRWWIDYRDHPGTASATAILDIERLPDEIPDEDASTDDGESAGETTCQGCRWQASFSVDPTITEPGCHQILAVFSDSPWKECPGMQCTESPTILARIVWWVWVWDGETLPPAPGVDTCGPVEVL